VLCGKILYVSEHRLSHSNAFELGILDLHFVARLQIWNIDGTIASGDFESVVSGTSERMIDLSAMTMAILGRSRRAGQSVLLTTFEQIDLHSQNFKALGVSGAAALRPAECL